MVLVYLKYSKSAKEVSQLYKNSTQDLVRQLLVKVDLLSDTINKQTETINKQTETINKQTEMLSQQSAIIAELTEALKNERAENLRLKEQLNKNSKNSSKPPSSDGLNKPALKSLRSKTGKKQGAQNGHEGSGLKITKDPDEIINHIPTICSSCSNLPFCGEGTVCSKKYEIDLVIETKVTLHQAIRYVCPKTDNVILTGELPEHLKATKQYGQNLQALVIALNTLGMVGINRTHELVSGLFCIPISTGTIYKMVTECAAKLAGTIACIKQEIITSPIAHFDETGFRIDNKTSWLHSASTTRHTYLNAQPKRGFEGMEAAGVLPFFKGIAMHDCWPAYFKYDQMDHAVSNAHLLRELTGVIENHPDQTWAQEMIALLLKMKAKKERAYSNGKTYLSAYYHKLFDTEYMSILEKGRWCNPITEKPAGKRGRQGKGKIRALIERLYNYKVSVCLFVKNINVTFDNNLAERDIRMMKVKAKVSGCFRTTEGADTFATIMSYLGTARKRGIQPMIALQKAIRLESNFIFEY